MSHVPCVYMDCEDVLEMIQWGMARTARWQQKRHSGKELWVNEEADQAAVRKYAIKYST